MTKINNDEFIKHNRITRFMMIFCLKLKNDSIESFLRE